MELSELINKYNMTFAGGNRLYIIDLDTTSISFENTTPYYFKYQNFEIYENSWKNLLPKLFLILDEINPKPDYELIDLKNDWGKQEVFGHFQFSNYIKVREGLFINCNHTAIHSFKTLQLLLRFYGIRSDSCIFVIKRQPISEPSEVKTFYSEMTQNKFHYYLKYVKKLSDRSITNVINNISIVNKKYLQKISRGYMDFYLIEDPAIFLNYMSKTKEKIALESIYPLEIQEVIFRQLSYLYDFIRVDRMKRIKEMPSFLECNNLNESDKSLDSELSEYLDLGDLA